MKTRLYSAREEEDVDPSRLQAKGVTQRQNLVGLNGDIAAPQTRRSWAASRVLDTPGHRPLQAGTF